MQASSSSAVQGVDTTVREGDSEATGADTGAVGREKGEKGTQWFVIDAGKERDLVSDEM